MILALEQRLRFEWSKHRNRERKYKEEQTRGHFPIKLFVILMRKCETPKEVHKKQQPAGEIFPSRLFNLANVTRGGGSTQASGAAGISLSGIRGGIASLVEINLHCCTLHQWRNTNKKVTLGNTLLSSKPAALNLLAKAK